MGCATRSIRTEAAMTDAPLSQSRSDIGTHGRELILDARNIAVDFKVEGGVVNAVRDAFDPRKTFR
jgi:hypothetical protein